MSVSLAGQFVCGFVFALRQTLPIPLPITIAIRLHAYDTQHRGPTQRPGLLPSCPIEPIMSSLVLISLLSPVDGKLLSYLCLCLDSAALPAPPTVYLLGRIQLGDALLLFRSISGVI